jgi:DNA damage-inducible protein 1
MQNNFRPPVAQAANVNSSDANLLNSFFTDLSK